MDVLFTSMQSLDAQHAFVATHRDGTFAVGRTNSDAMMYGARGWAVWRPHDMYVFTVIANTKFERCILRGLKSLVAIPERL